MHELLMFLLYDVAVILHLSLRPSSPALKPCCHVLDCLRGVFTQPALGVLHCEVDPSLCGACT